jgi:hypothetical protein
MANAGDQAGYYGNGINTLKRRHDPHLEREILLWPVFYKITVALIGSIHGCQ